MQKITGYIFLSLMMGLISACGGGGGEACSPAATCDVDGSTIQACCTSSSCRYVTDSRTFPCNGVDCSSAAQEVANFCQGTAQKSQNNLLKSLLIEKADNIVLKKSIDGMYIDLGDEVSQ